MYKLNEYPLEFDFLLAAGNQFEIFQGRYGGETVAIKTTKHLLPGRKEGSTFVSYSARSKTHIFSYRGLCPPVLAMQKEFL